MGWVFHQQKAHSVSAVAVGTTHMVGHQRHHSGQLLPEKASCCGDGVLWIGKWKTEAERVRTRAGIRTAGKHVGEGRGGYYWQQCHGCPVPPAWSHHASLGQLRLALDKEVVQTQADPLGTMLSVA